jgi:hypothetical protein
MKGKFILVAILMAISSSSYELVFSTEAFASPLSAGDIRLFAEYFSRILGHEKTALSCSHSLTKTLPEIVKSFPEASTARIELKNRIYLGRFKNRELFIKARPEETEMVQMEGEEHLYAPRKMTFRSGLEITQVEKLSREEINQGASEIAKESENAESHYIEWRGNRIIGEVDSKIADTFDEYGMRRPDTQASQENQIVGNDIYIVVTVNMSDAGNIDVLKRTAIIQKILAALAQE